MKPLSPIFLTKIIGTVFFIPFGMGCFVQSSFADLAGKTYVDNAIETKVGKTGDESIAGTKTFDAIPLTQTSALPAVNDSAVNRFVTVTTLNNALETRVTNSQMATEIATAVAGTVKTTGDQNITGVKTFADIPMAPTPPLPEREF